MGQSGHIVGECGSQTRLSEYTLCMYTHNDKGGGSVCIYMIYIYTCINIYIYGCV